MGDTIVPPHLEDSQTSMTELSSNASNHDLLKAVILFQRRYRFTQSLKTRCSKRSNDRKLAWEAVADGSEYLLEYSKILSMSGPTSSYEVTELEMLQERRQFYEIMSSFKNVDVPIILFVKALRRGRVWGADGELRDESLELSYTVPRCLYTLFKLGSKAPEDLQLPLARRLRFLTARHKGGQWCLSIMPSMKNSILRDMAPEKSRERQISILLIFLKAFPEEYSQILWEELRLHLDDVLRTTIIPILRVISLKDLQKYHRRHEKILREGLCSKLLDFLLSILPRYEFLNSLVSEIADYLFRFPEGQSGKNTNTLLQLHMMIKKRFGLDQHLSTLKKLVCVDGRSNPNLNARIGIILGRLLSSRTTDETLRKVHAMWGPIIEDYPSSLENLAVAYQIKVGSPSTRPLGGVSTQISRDPFDDNNQDRPEGDTNSIPGAARSLQNMQLAEASVPMSSSSSLSPLMKPLVGFIYAQRGLFSLAKKTLRDSMSDIEHDYGPLSWELGVVVAEVAKCCNMLQQYRLAEQMLRSALQRRAALTSRPDSQYLQVILADTLLAKANYVDAAEVLESVFSSDTSVSSPIVMKAAIRTAKIHRRLGEVFPSPKVISHVTRGLQASDEVSVALRSAFILEISRNIARVDRRNTTIQEEIQELADVLEEIQSSRYIDNEDQRNQARLLQTHLRRIEHLHTFGTPQSLTRRHLSEYEAPHPTLKRDVQAPTRSPDSVALWDAYSVFGIIERSSRDMRCYGITQRGTRCQWGIPNDKYDSLRKLLDYIETRPPEDAKQYLRSISTLSLCEEYHQDQANDLVANWRNMLRGLPYNESLHESPQPGNTMAVAPSKPPSFEMLSAEKFTEDLREDKANLPSSNSSLSGSLAYKRCGASVMGLWASRTRRKFVYGQFQFRFEVIFETPVLFVAPPNNMKGPLAGREIHYIDGTPESYKNTLTMSREEDGQRMRQGQRINTADDELATWLNLLSALQSKENSSRKWDRQIQLAAFDGTEHANARSYKISLRAPRYDLAAAIQSKTQSWDMMPPQITKPYATTALCHLVEMMAMLGIYWKAFDPATWNLRAEGNGYSLSSTNVPGLGVMVLFTITGNSKFNEHSVIPCHELKQLSFGVIPTIYLDKQNLGIIPTDLVFGSTEDTANTLRNLGLSPTTVNRYKQSHQYIFPLSFGIMGMLGKVFRIRGSHFRMLPNPTCEGWVAWGRRPGSWDILRLMEQFQKEISPIIEISEAISLHQATYISDEWSRVLEPDSPITPYPLRLEVLEALHDSLDACTLYLQSQRQEDVISVFVAHVTRFLEELNSPLSPMQNLDTRSAVREARLMDCYFKACLLSVTGTDTDEGRTREDDIRKKHLRQSIWLTLIYRMLLWMILHDFNENDVMIVPSNLQGSRMPIYIG